MAENKFFSSPSVDVIEKSTKIVGDIFSKADFRIDGEVEGTITTSGKVVVGNNGKISGKLNCSNADISGNVSGTIEVSETLSLMSESYIKGENKFIRRSLLFPAGRRPPANTARAARHTPLNAY